MTPGQDAVDDGGARKVLDFEVEVNGRNKLEDGLVEVNCTGRRAILLLNSEICFDVEIV